MWRVTCRSGPLLRKSWRMHKQTVHTRANFSCKHAGGLLPSKLWSKLCRRRNDAPTEQELRKPGSRLGLELARPAFLQPHLALQIRRRLSFMQVDNFWIGSGQKETYSTPEGKKKWTRKNGRSSTIFTFPLVTDHIAYLFCRICSKLQTNPSMLCSPHLIFDSKHNKYYEQFEASKR